LAASERFPVAPQIEMNGIGEPSATRASDRVTGLMGPFVDSESLTAILKHLRHEWQTLQAAILVKGAENLFFASDLHPITGAKSHAALPIRVTNCSNGASSILPSELRSSDGIATSGYPDANHKFGAVAVA
jgi:hypothetical protein